MTGEVPLVTRIVRPQVSATARVWRWGVGASINWDIPRLVTAQKHVEPSVTFWTVGLGPLCLQSSYVHNDFGRGVGLFSLVVALSTFRRQADIVVTPFHWQRPWVKPLPHKLGEHHNRFFAGPFMVRLFSAGKSA